MAFVVNNQPSEFKQYFCKICTKRFGCGRALGGHMRAHGIGDESRYIDDDDPASDYEDKLGPSNKRMYGLRTNPNRLKSCRVCENCGKEFFSWKSFLEHGKCSSYKDVDQSVVSSEGDDIDVFTRRGSGNYWSNSKRKRTLRTEVGICPSSEEEDLANCLMMLSNATGNVPFVADQPEESSNTMNFISTPNINVPMDKAKGSVVAKGLFECKACKKVFNSHQALGRHRASHKKVKGCFAARFERNHIDDGLADDEDRDEFFVTKSTPTFRFDHTLTASTSKKKSKVHECSICHRIFSSGQALGGHKRCHWITSNSPADHHTSSLVKFDQFQDHQRPKFVDNSKPLDLKLDLNLPVSTEIYMQQLQSDNNNNNGKIKNSICNSPKQNEEDKEDRKVKFAKLSELKDVNINGGSSRWLQVGIGSTTNVGSNDP